MGRRSAIYWRLFATLLTLAFLAFPGHAQQKKTAQRPATREFPRDEGDDVRRREEWFYQQRAFPSGHLPAGARLRAFQHMQRMMEAEGKIVRKADGAIAAGTNASVGPAWMPIGPAPTQGGFFTPVSGRVTTIAVDPSDFTGNTVLIGGAQGGIWRTTDAGNTWTPVGDMNPSLAMGSIAFANPSSPGGSGVVYAGTGEQASVGFDIYYGAGVLKSADGGLTWSPTCSTPGPTCPFIGPFNSFTFGFFNDGGARISYVAVNPSNPSLVLAGAQIPQPGVSELTGGVYCSDDGGATWSNILAGEMSTFVGFANHTTAYAALGRTVGTLIGSPNPNGIYKSANADGGAAKKCSGITFSNLTANGISGIPASSLGRIDMGIAASDTTGNTVYASIADASISPFTGFSRSSRTNLGVFKTTNGGTSWTQTGAPDICRRQCWYDNVVKVDPTNANNVFLGGGAVIIVNGPSFSFAWVMRSSDGGATWNPAVPTSLFGGDPTLPHVDEHAMAFVKTGSTVRLYLGNDGGMWRTDDATAPGTNWINLNSFPLQLTQFYPSLSIHPSNPGRGFAGAQDNGSQNFLGANAWTDNQSCGDGGWTLIDPVTPSTVYILCQVISLQKSLTNGAPGTFSLAFNGIGTGRVNFIAPMAIDAANPQRLYFGASTVYQSVDGANSWQALNNGSPLSVGRVTVALAVGGGINGNVVYAGTNDGQVFEATDVSPGTGTFSPVGQGQLPNRVPTQIVMDPSDPTGNTAYVTFSGFSGFNGDLKGHVFQTTSGGNLWADVSCAATTADCSHPALTDLPNLPVNDLVIDPDVPGTLYAATDLGVFQGNCAGAACTWTTLNNSSLPNVAVLSLRLHEPSRTLVAATHGRGAWQLVLTNFSFSGPHLGAIDPTSANIGTSVNITLSVSGSGLAPGGVAGQILWNGSATGVAMQPGGSDTSLSASIDPSLLGSGGTPKVTVLAGGQSSNALTFTVIAPAPAVFASAPGSIPASAAATLTITGANFIASSVLRINNNGGSISDAIALPAGSVTNGGGTITLTVPASAQSVQNPGTYFISVFNPPPGGGDSSNGFVFGPTLVVTPANSNPPPNDNFNMAINCSGGGTCDTTDNVNATTNTGGVNDPLPSCVQNIPPPFNPVNGGAANSIWYKFTAMGPGNVEADTIGSFDDTILDVFTGTAGNLMEVPGACNDDIRLGIIRTSQVMFTATQGTTYFFMVSSFQGFGGKIVFNVNANLVATDFSIAANPTAATVTRGGSATTTLSVSPNSVLFPGNVTFQCAGLPTESSCLFIPAMVAQVTGPTQVSLTITTMAPSILPPAGNRRPGARPLGLLLWSLAALSLVALFAARRANRRWAYATSAALVLFLAGLAMSCGGGGGGSSSGGGNPGTQPLGPSTVVVTATSGNVTHQVPFTLTVQ